MYTTYYASSSLISFLSLLSIMCVYTTTATAAAACRSSSKQTKMKLVTIKLLTLEFYRWLVFMGFIDDFYLVSFAILFFFSALLFICLLVCLFVFPWHACFFARQGFGDSFGMFCTHTKYERNCMEIDDILVQCTYS